jgi:hypothetical protein
MAISDEVFFRRVQNCGLKPKTQRVWQTLDEQDHYSVPDPATIDDDEKREFLKELRARLGLPPVTDLDDDDT